jgi:hypothetical protein
VRKEKAKKVKNEIARKEKVRKEKVKNEIARKEKVKNEKVRKEKVKNEKVRKEKVKLIQDHNQDLLLMLLSRVFPNLEHQLFLHER